MQGPFSSHGLAHAAEGRQWSEIKAFAGHDLCLVNSTERADAAYSSKRINTELTTLMLR